jgi:hypothetical protein
MQFEMPEYSVVNEPNNIAKVNKCWRTKGSKTVKVQTEAAHGFRQGDVVSIVDSGKKEPDKVFTGTFTITSVPQFDMFKYKVSTAALVASSPAITATATRTRSSTTSYPLDSLAIARVMRKTVGETTRSTIYIQDHDLTEDVAITVVMGSPGESSFEGDGKPLPISDVLPNTFTYENSGPEVGKTTISKFSRTAKGVVTITTVEDHGYANGQQVEISIAHATSSFGAQLNGKEMIISGVTPAAPKVFSYVPNGPLTSAQKVVVTEKTAASGSVAYSTVAASAGSTLFINYELFGSTRDVTSVACATVSGSKYVTLGVVDHGYRAGDYIQLTLYGKAYQQYVYTTKDSKNYLKPNLPVEISSVTDDEVTYILPANHTYLGTMTDLSKVTVPSGMGAIGLAAQIEKAPVVVTRSYGEFPDNADIGGFDFSDTNYSDLQIQNSVLRGSDMTNVAQILEGYSNNSNGFDYRIDCSLTYDSLGNKMFKRTFVLIPITPVTYKDYLNGLPDKKLPVGTYAPASAFGADKLLFEFPGNVSNFNLSENSSNAATRVFVVGNNDDTGGAASARYSAASATNLLADGWPLLDKSEAQEWPLTGVNAINVDNWGNYDAELDFSVTAERFLNESRPPLGDFIVSVNGSLNPVVGTYNPGDWCSLVVNDDFFRNRMSSILEPRKDVVVRKIDGVKVSVPNSPAFPEQIDLTLITEWQVDAIGK